MPEPHFDQIAREMAERAFPSDVITVPKPYWSTRQELVDELVERLREIWNARGAADAQAVEERLATLTGWVTSEPYRQHLREAIAALDSSA